MNYFDPYPLCFDKTVTTAWNSQLAEAESTPWFARTLAVRASELFPQFVAAYTNLRAMPRGARRSVQRRLARSRDLLDCLPEWLKWGEGRRLRYKLARSVAGAALLLALCQGAQAATITVTTNKPGINDGDGQCSLTEAIVNANNDVATYSDCVAGSGADTIVLPAKKIITLTTPYTNYPGGTGLPVITSQITIEGNGARIQRKKGAIDFRLFAVSSLGNLDLESVIITGGKSSRGGGISNAGQLTVANSTISGNTADLGGGIYNAAVGNLTLDTCTIFNNTAGFGGGVHNDRGNVTVVNSRISMNRASEFGGGIGESLFSSGIGNIVISDTTISKNSGVGGVFLTSNTSIIENSTVAGNRFLGIFRYRGVGTIDNTTISGNHLGGINSESSGTLTITNSTITNNTGDQIGGVLNHGTLILQRTLISGNKRTSGLEAQSIGGTVVAGNFNLFGANGNAGVSGFALGPTDIVPGVGVTVGKILGPLKNNGGPTKTHALVPGSPAIDAIPGADPECTGTDQRGTPRPQGAGCDIGAFEK